MILSYGWPDMAPDWAEFFFPYSVTHKSTSLRPSEPRLPSHGAATYDLIIKSLKAL
jgi:hypothetical protein